jgi:hypothetical protein
MVLQLKKPAKGGLFSSKEFGRMPISVLLREDWWFLARKPTFFERSVYDHT